MKLIKNWAFATFILCFLVIIAGGVVRTTQSGMGCPDWPRCFGKWIPPTNAAELPADFEKYLGKQDIDHSFNVWHTWIEYVNRLLGVLLGLFAVIQVAVLISRRKSLRSAWRLAIAFLLTVIITGLFGAIVVKYNLAHLSISVHLLFAIILLQIQLALWLAVNNRVKDLPAPAAIYRAVGIFLCILLMQAILGTMVRIHVDDVSKLLNYEMRETWLANEPIIFLIHRSSSWLVLITAVGLAWYSRKQHRLAISVKWLTATVFANMVTGIVLYYADMPAAAQPLHLLLAAIAITQTVALLLRIAPQPVKDLSHQ